MQPARVKFVCALVLFLATVFAYRQVVEHDFINFDDPSYVQNNPLIHGGLTLNNIKRAFSEIQAGYWIPVTWISYQCDYTLHGLSPGGYHRTNLLLHAANVVLLFLVLCRLTGTIGRSAVVAALFALHPIQVESVAWVTERKDVLSTLFWLLTIWAYVRYAERPGWWRYLLVMLFLALGLMAKPMLVTLPCVLLLLDFWPLRRFRREDGQMGSIYRVILEKVPLLLLALAAGLVTVFAQEKGTAVRSLDDFPISARLGNVVVSYVVYLAMLLWPVHLGVFYPHPGTLPLGQVLASAALLLTVTALAVRYYQTAPYLLVGWLWYLGTLFPVSGILQVGWQARADRFLYVPSMGLFLLVVWGLAELMGHERRQRQVLVGLTSLVLVACLVGTMFQVRHWRNSLTLWEHTMKVTPDNFVARDSLGAALLDEGRIDEALVHLWRARELKPDHELSYCLLAAAYRQQGHLDDAVRCWQDALNVNSRCLEAHAQLAITFAEQQRLTEAEHHALQALRLDPQSPVAHHCLGVLRSKQGRSEEALASHRLAVQLNPHAIPYRVSLAQALEKQGNHAAAEAEYCVIKQLYPAWNP